MLRRRLRSQEHGTYVQWPNTIMPPFFTCSNSDVCPYANSIAHLSCILSRVHRKESLSNGQISIRRKQTPLRSSLFLPLLLGLEVVEKDRSLLRLLTPILDDNTGAVDNLACISLAVQHTQTSPLAQLFSVWNFDQRDLVF